MSTHRPVPPPEVLGADDHDQRRAASRGMALGFLGVLAFSLTLPMTRVAVAEIDPVWLAFGRAELAAALAALALFVRGVPLPPRRHWGALFGAALGVVLGFPLLSSLAMRTTEAGHGSIIVALLPLATVIAAARLAHERPTPAFWAAALAGSAVVLGFALSRGSGSLSVGDLALLAAVAAGALGYAYGGMLSRHLGGWQTICWILVFSAPLLLIPTLWLTAVRPFAQVSWQAWAAFGYVSVFSQLVGFFFWYGGMALGGVARVSQVQLLQLFLTLIFAGLINGESVGPATWLVAAVVVLIVALGRGAGVLRPRD